SVSEQIGQQREERTRACLDKSGNAQVIDKLCGLGRGEIEMNNKRWLRNSEQRIARKLITRARRIRRNRPRLNERNAGHKLLSSRIHLQRNRLPALNGLCRADRHKEQDSGRCPLLRLKHNAGGLNIRRNTLLPGKDERSNSQKQ